MERYNRKKCIAGIMIVLISAGDIFFLVLSGKMGGKWMTLGIIMLAVGFYAVQVGRNELIEIKKSPPEELVREKKDRIEEKAQAVSFFIMQLIFFAGIVVSAAVWWILDSYNGMFTGIVVVQSVLLTVSFVIESIAEYIINPEKYK